MSDAPDVIEHLSSALAERTAAMRGAVAAIRLSDDRHLTGTLWQSDLVVASDQSLPRRDAFELRFADRPAVSATVVGRDPATNVALLRPADPAPAPPVAAAVARPGVLTLAVGAEASGEVTLRLGVVNRVGPQWHSSAGGRIDARIELDLRLSSAEEGGPVLDAAGSRLGITTFGPQGEVLVIPAATIERTLPALLATGRIDRGWLGVALRPVAVPDALAEQAGQSSGQMVMSTVDGGPAAKAGIVPGDIVLSVNGTPARRLRSIATHLGPESIGRTADLRLIRGGTVLAVRATIEARGAP